MTHVRVLHAEDGMVERFNPTAERAGRTSVRFSLIRNQNPLLDDFDETFEAARVAVSDVVGDLPGSQQPLDGRQQSGIVRPHQFRHEAIPPSIGSEDSFRGHLSQSQRRAERPLRGKSGRCGAGLLALPRSVGSLHESRRVHVWSLWGGQDDVCQAP